MEGRPVSSQADAKRVACLIACERLYDAGALTELLLLKSKENAYSLDAIAPESNSTTGKAYPNLYMCDCRCHIS